MSALVSEEAGPSFRGRGRGGGRKETRAHRFSVLPVFLPLLSLNLFRRSYSSTWTLLHTLVSSLPPTPSPLQQSHLAALLLSLTVLYPCPHCRKDFAVKVERAGGEAAILEAVKTRAGAEKYVWERHEEVNEKLGKEGGVTLEEVRKRWKDGGPECGW